MREFLHRSYSTALYAVLGILLIFNVLTLITGNFVALFSIALQVVVLISVYLGKPWTYIVVRVWACFFVIAGAFMWLAVLFGGLAYFHSLWHALVYTAFLALGFYFFAFSKPALYQSGNAI